MQQCSMFKKALSVISLLAIAGSVSAQVVFNSLEDVWKYADAHNITIRTAGFEADKAIYARKQAYGTLLPQVNATGSFTDNLALQTTLIPSDFLPNGTPGAYREVQFGQQYVYAGGLNAQLSILNLQNWYNAKIARQTEEINKDSVANTRKTIYQQIATQYYSYLLMQEAYRISTTSAGIADSVLQSTQNKFRQGTLSEANVDIAKLNAERAQQNQLSALYQVIIAKNNIRSLLGMSVNDSLTISARLDNGFDIAESGSFAEDPVIRIARMKEQISLSQYRNTNSAFLPTLNLTYNFSAQRFGNTFEPFARDTGTKAFFPSQYWMLQASLPIFTGGSRMYASRRNKIAYNESKEQYESIRRQSAINDENLVLNYRKALAVLLKAQSIMNLSFDNYRHVSNRYEAGIVSFDDKLSAFKDYLDYQNQYLNSLSDLLVQTYQVKIRMHSF